MEKQPRTQEYQLVDWSLIKKAVKINNPESISRSTLNSVYELMRDICYTNKYLALAGTQIPETEIGDCIYILGLNRFRFVEGLVLSPEISECFDYRLHIEGCGSINKGRTGFIAKRPNRLRIVGYLYVPNRELEAVESVVCGLESGLIAHEMEHLNGGSIRSNPYHLVNPTDKLQQTMYSHLYPEMPFYELLREYVRYRYFDNWLVKDSDEIVTVETEKLFPDLVKVS